MGLALPSSWTESERRITSEFQQFGLRPVGETDPPRKCNGCGSEPPTAFLTVYAPGAFDPSGVQTGQSVTVNADGDGFLRPSENGQDAVLAWRYADDAWATVRGRTALASERDRMLELARALRPTDRTAIRLPVSIPDVPSPMSLVEINIDRGRYGTTIVFGGCATTDERAYRDCPVQAGDMRVQIWPADGYSGLIDEKDAVPMKIGGRNGLYDAAGQTAAVQVQPGMVAVLAIPKAALTDILATLTWAPDPGDEKTWPAVADWSKPN